MTNELSALPKILRLTAFPRKRESSVT